MVFASVSESESSESSESEDEEDSEELVMSLSSSSFVPSYRLHLFFADADSTPTASASRSPATVMRLVDFLPSSPAPPPAALGENAVHASASKPSHTCCSSFFLHHLSLSFFRSLLRLRLRFSFLLSFRRCVRQASSNALIINSSCRCCSLCKSHVAFTNSCRPPRGVIAIHLGVRLPGVLIKSSQLGF